SQSAVTPRTNKESSSQAAAPPRVNKPRTSQSVVNPHVSKIENQILRRFKSLVEGVIELEIGRKKYTGNQQIVDVTLFFSSVGNFMGYDLNDPSSVDVDYFAELMSDFALVIPESPPSITKLNVEVSIPFEDANETLRQKVNQGRRVPINELVITQAKPELRAEYLEKPSHFDFQLRSVSELIFDEKQGLQVTVDTNWSDYFSPPIVAVAPVELFYAHSVGYNEKLIRDLDIRFDESNGTIVLNNTNNLDAGEYTILLEIINGRSVINYQTVSFKLKKNLNYKKKMQQLKERLDTLRD
ncbi:MAG: hypothetical protein P8N92_07355, partial [Burkholderiales bacterium]|nr:hypothetical protein [Burkholderiales bacterium]